MRKSKIFWRKALESQKAFWENEKTLRRHSDSQARIQAWLSYQTLFLQFVNLNGDENFLDIGCGPTGIMACFKTPNRYGLDPLIRFYKRRYSLNTGIKYIEGTGEELPFKNASFDVAFMFNTLDQIENPQSILSEINRIIKKGGHVFCGVDTFSGLTYIKDKTKKIFRRLTGTCDHHTHSFSEKRFRGLLRKNQLDVLYFGEVANGRKGETIAVCRKE